MTDGHILERVVPGLDEYFLRRQRECRNVFRNIGWIHNVTAGGGHYLCPGRQRYKPWMEKQCYHKANNIWVTDFQTGCIANPNERFRGANSELQYGVTPSLWADSAVESFCWTA